MNKPTKFYKDATEFRLERIEKLLNIDPDDPSVAGAGLSTAILDVLKERQNQDKKWGPPDHDPFCFLTLLMEEVGELSQAALHTRFGGSEAGRMREEAVQVAAVALSIIECLDNNKWKWGT